MLIEMLTICSMIFGAPYYDCDNTWDIYMYDDPMVGYNGTEWHSYLIMEIGDQNSTQIHLGANYNDYKWYGIPYLYFYLISAACECDMEAELERVLSLEKV